MTTNFLAPRTTGLLFILFIAISAMHYGVIEVGLTQGAVKAVEFARGNESLFRAGIILDLLIFLTTVILANAIYSILKPFESTFSRLGLLSMIIQAPVSIAIEFSSLAILWFAADTTQADTMKGLGLIDLILGLRAQGYNIVILFFAVGYLSFFLSFFKSRLVPRLLSLAGALVTLIFLLATIAQIMLPTPMIISAGMAISGFVMLHQVVFGGWLIAKGVNTPVTS